MTGGTGSSHQPARCCWDIAGEEQCHFFSSTCICSLANLDSGDRNYFHGSRISPIQPSQGYSQHFSCGSPSGHSQMQHSIHFPPAESAPHFRSVEEFSDAPAHNPTSGLQRASLPTLSAFYWQITTPTAPLSFLAESILCHIHVGGCEETTLLHSRGSSYLCLEL